MDKRRGPTSYAELKRACEGAVVRWQWGTLLLHDLRPYYPQRFGYSPPRPLKKRPEKLNRAREYGLDASGRVAVIRRHTKFEGQMDEDFFVYGDDWVEQSAFKHHDKQNAIQSLYRFDKGRLLSWEQQTRLGLQTERYTHEGWRCSRVVFTEANGAERTFELSHHDDGSLARVTSPARGQTCVIYASPEPGFDDMAARMVDMLVDHIPRQLERLGLEDEVYCVGLVYTDDTNLLPPELGCGNESQRLNWLADRGEAAPETIWSPEDWIHFGADPWVIQDEAMAALGEAIGRHLQERGDCSAGVELLVRVARKLQKLDWSGVLRTTGDFVVAPVSLEAGLTAAGLKAIPAALRKKLDKKGAI